MIAHNLCKICLLEAYNAIYKHDFQFISETCFNSSGGRFFDSSGVLQGDKSIQLIGFNMIRAKCNKANVECIKKSIESVNWELIFSNKSVDKQVSIFSETLVNIFSNFTPDKLLTFDDRDPPWMNYFVKSEIK